MNLFYALLLIFVVSWACVNNDASQGVDPPPTRAKVQTQFNNEEYFTIHRRTKDPVLLTFNKRSANPIKVPLEGCVSITVSQYPGLLISVGDPMITLCGDAKPCLQGNYKIVDESPRIAPDGKLEDCPLVLPDS